MGWDTSFDTHVWIFNVGRGIAAFVRSGLNQGFIIDMGCSEDFSPADFVRKHFVPKLDSYKGKRIAQALLSHPHQDHIAECGMLDNGLQPQLLTCPNDKDPQASLNWNRIKNPKGSDQVVHTYHSLYESRSLPLQTIEYQTNRTLATMMEYGVYFLRPPDCEKLHPSDDNAYGNATSIVMYFRHGTNSILFPGDITPEALNHILAGAPGVEKRFTVFDRSSTREHPKWHLETCDQPSLGTKLLAHGLSILVAPHHGLESCYCTKLYDYIRGGKPDIVAISEKRQLSDTDGSVHQGYQSANASFGLRVDVEGTNERRNSVTTRNGHHILAKFSGSGVPRIYLSSDPLKLLAKL